jgi:hypothetical protein
MALQRPYLRATIFQSIQNNDIAGKPGKFIVQVCNSNPVGLKKQWMRLKVYWKTAGSLIGGTRWKSSSMTVHIFAAQMCRLMESALI